MRVVLTNQKRGNILNVLRAQYNAVSKMIRSRYSDVIMRSSARATHYFEIRHAENLAIEQLYSFWLLVKI